MAPVFEYEFARNALIAGLLSSIACGVIGSLVVSRRIAGICGGIAHASFGGVGLGYLLGFNPFWGALLFGALSAVGIGWLSRRSKRSEDTSIAIFWAVGMSLGVIFVGLRRGYAPDLMTYLFGNILSVSRGDLAVILALDLLIGGLLALFFREILALCYDEEFARVRGLPVFPLSLLLLILSALTVVILMKVVGIILVVALLTLPAATVAPFARTLKGMMAASTAVAAALIFGGLALSYRLDLPSGATVVLLAAAVYGLSLLLTRRRR